MLPGPWATAGRSYAETTLGTSFDPRALRGTRWSDEVRLYVASHAIFKSRQFRFELFELTLQELHARPKTLRLDMIPPLAHPQALELLMFFYDSLVHNTPLSKKLQMVLLSREFRTLPLPVNSVSQKRHHNRTKNGSDENKLLGYVHPSLFRVSSRITIE